MASGKFQKWFSITFSFMLLLQNCCLYEIDHSAKVIQDLKEGEVLEHPIKDSQIMHAATTDYDSKYLLTEDALDKDIREISADFYSSRHSKRSLTYVITGLASMATAVFATLDVMCPSLLKKIKKVKNLKKKVSEETREINTDWSYVDSKTRYLQRLSADVSILKRSIEKMDELKSDIITLVDPTLLDDIVTLREKTKILVQQANDSATKIEILNKKKLQTSLYISASVFAGLQFLLLGGYFHHLNRIVYYRKELAKPFAFREARIQWGKGLAQRKIKLHYRGAHLLTAFSVALSAVQAAITLTTCAVLSKKLNKAESRANEAISDLNDIRDKMSLLNNLTDGNYSVVWNELASNTFSDFVSEAIETAKSNEVINSKTNQSIDNMMDFYKNFNRTQSSSGKVNYQLVESLTKKLIEGFLDGNHNLNCYRKKSKIVKIISDKCAKGHSTFDELWYLAKNMDRNNLKDCSTNKKYVTKKGVRKIIKLSMKQRNKQEICIRNNQLTKLIICEAYLKGDVNLVNKSEGLTQLDVDFFVSNCDLPEVNENVQKMICRLKANNEPKENIFVTYKKFNATNLNNAWENCSLTRIQKDDICSLRQSAVSLADIIEIYHNYPPNQVKMIYNSCTIQITPVIEKMICKWHSNPRASGLIKKFERKYGKDAVQKVISEKCNN